MAADRPTSRTLLERVRANDQQAWQRLVELYKPLVAHWCLRWGVRDDADDVCQEVFQGLASSLLAFQEERSGATFRGWLRGITRNKLLEHCRRRHRQPEAQGGSDAHRQLAEVPDLIDDDPPEEVSDLYHRALEQVRVEFEVKTWQAFWRATIDGHAVDMIAADLGVTSAAVRKSKSRVLRRLKDEVGDLIR